MLRLWASKNWAFHLLGDMIELLKRMNNHHQNARTFMRNWTGSFTHQLNTGRKTVGVVGESENKTKEGRRGKSVWSEFGQYVISLMAQQRVKMRTWLRWHETGEITPI